MLDDKGQPRAELFQKTCCTSMAGYRLWANIVQPRLSGEISQQPGPANTLQKSTRSPVCAACGADAGRCTAQRGRLSSRNRRTSQALDQTPYSNNSLGGINHASWFARQGYAVVIADSRGGLIPMAGGTPSHRCIGDGYDLVSGSPPSPGVREKSARWADPIRDGCNGGPPSRRRRLWRPWCCRPRSGRDVQHLIRMASWSAGD